jgi:hypothetical protein
MRQVWRRIRYVCHCFLTERDGRWLVFVRHRMGSSVLCSLSACSDCRVLLTFSELFHLGTLLETRRMQMPRLSSAHIRATLSLAREE